MTLTNYGSLFFEKVTGISTHGAALYSLMAAVKHLLSYKTISQYKVCLIDIYGY